MPLVGDPSHDIHEMAHSPRHSGRVKKFGKKKAHKIEVAAAMDAQRRKKSRKSGRRK